VPVKETFGGSTVWKGLVHVFAITGHPKAKQACAWSSPIEDSDKRLFFAVLHLPPVGSPVEAVSRLSSRSIARLNEDGVSSIGASTLATIWAAIVAYDCRHERRKMLMSVLVVARFLLSPLFLGATLGMTDGRS
jgi:hypothetical protein